MLNSTCPCCSNTLLRHIRSNEIYWFCSHCHQEMPNFSDFLSNVEFSRKLSSSSSLTKHLQVA